MKKNKQKQNDNPIAIGKAVFKKTAIKKQITKYQAIKMLAKNKWIMQSNKSKQRKQWKLRQLFNQIDQCQVQTLIISFPKNCTIIKEIQHIKFSLLVQLSLSRNNINNIEGLLNVDFINVKFLYLGINQISQISSFNKLSLKFLAVLSLHDNPIRQIVALSRANLIQNSVTEQFNLDMQSFNTIQKNQIICQDLGKLLKLNPLNISHKYIRLSYRIDQSKITKMLNSKYPIQ